MNWRMGFTSISKISTAFYTFTVVEKLPDGMYIKNRVRLFIIKQVVTN